MVEEKNYSGNNSSPSWSPPVDPVPELLVRSPAEVWASPYATQAETLCEIVNIGTYAFKWCFQAGENQKIHAPVILLLRHMIALTDAVSLLIRNGSVEPAKLIVRSAFEGLLGVAHILECDSDRRSDAYAYVLIKKKMRVSASFGTTEKLGTLARQHALDSGDIGKYMEVLAKAREKTRIAERLIDSPRYSYIRDEESRLRLKRKRRPSWYEYFVGPTNLEELAERLGYSAQYELHYRMWSGPVHSLESQWTALMPSEDGSIEAEPLRRTKDLDAVTRAAVGFSLDALGRAVERYVPEKKKDFHLWIQKRLPSSYYRIKSTDDQSP